MHAIKLRSAEECLWDEVSLGEIMLRLDPGDGRVRNAREFRVWEGGGEYNVARGLRKCFEKRTAVVTGLVRNEVGALVEDLILQGGVDVRYVHWLPYDGVGENARVGLNFTERGYGVRKAKGVNDRGHSAASKLRPEDIDWKRIFEQEGARWFHTGGIYAGLSETTPEVIIEAMKAARNAGTIVSYDLNYRPSLWKRFGGQEKAREVNRRIAPYVDVMLGNEEDFTASLGYEVAGVDENLTGLDAASFRNMIGRVTSDYSNFQAVATTLRDVKSASKNDWGAVLWHNGEFYEAVHRPGLDIFDRVGGGDSFASGLIYGFLEGMDPQSCVDFGAAHGALAMTTPGDTSMVTADDVASLAAGGSARVDR